MSRLNYHIILFVLGVLLVINGGFIVLSSIASVINDEPDMWLLALSGFVTAAIGAVTMAVFSKHKKQMASREGYLIVTFGWLIMALSGMVPYLVTTDLSITDAFFETISGYTTTGASVINDIEALPKGLLLWRSMTHWIGGMGIIVLAVAILPLLGIGGMQLFSAEAPGPSADKLHPRIKDTAKRLWLIYFGFTIAEGILLRIAGMNWFDAINHALSTLSTGGFSTKNLSLAYWNDQPVIQYIVIFFMLLAGTNFVLSYFAFKGRIRKILMDEEWRLYLFFIALFTLIATATIIGKDAFAASEYNPMVWGANEAAFRHSLFSVLAVITTTGFVTADFTAWTPLITILFFGMFFLGGSAGSTSGGVKVVRQLILIKNSLLEFRRTLHPSAVIPVRYNGKAIKSPVVYNILAFFIIYMLSFIFGAIGLAADGLDFVTALGGAASSLGNVGPAFGDLNPLSNFANLSDFSKWWCGFLMLIGRLELFTVLILLTPYFWRNR